MAAAEDTQSEYFSSYNDLSVHQLMLMDRPRTLAYRKFFENNRDLVKDKIVMDVGAGTGILSLFAATGEYYIHMRCIIMKCLIYNFISHIICCSTYSGLD